MKSLTEKQKNFILYTLKSEYSFHRRGENIINSVWIVPSLVLDLEDKMNPMTIGAMITTLRKKGIITVIEEKIENKKVKIMELTEDGKDILKSYRRKK